jgi:hypothetical protein
LHSNLHIADADYRDGDSVRGTVILCVKVILCEGGVAHLHSNLHSIFVILRNTRLSK